MEPQSGKKKDIIFFPIIIAWVAFILKLILNTFVFIEIFGSDFSKHPEYPAAIIIDDIGTLISSIFITISFQKNKYCLYKNGFIIALVLAIPMTIFLSTALGKYSNNDRYYDPYDNYDKYKSRYIPMVIIAIAIEWSQFIVQMLYNNKIKSSFLDSELNFNLINNAPQEIQPQVLAESKASI